MNVLFTAVGSIGSRHINNLTALCAEKGIDLTIDAIRYSERELSSELRSKIRNEIRVQSQLESHYDILFVTDETRTHYDNIIRYRSLCEHMFIEKPIFDTLDYPIDEIKPQSDKSVYYVAAPIRFSNYYNQLRKLVDNNNVYSARIIFSSYMPSWQLGRDYRKSFRCFESRGGGVDIDLLHELDYALELFGKPEKVYRVAGKYSNLEMDACDLAVYILEYKDKVVEIHLDYFGRVRNRQTELYTQDDVIVVDFNKHSTERRVTSQSEEYGEENQFYQNEMAYFIELVLSEGKMININTPSKAYQTLKVTKGII
ncbi:hypothetical protein AAE250_21230 [Bacteroides sp. GD17]|jgi:predicted dehydrogenase|uniref:hypothetical protein n=1 Tax=Bacteroides sp. GD17 TaxID=3139826 RepID=UPI0025CCE433|nr:hypothetical protein [uncultured Bacteroides sp.]